MVIYIAILVFMLVIIIQVIFSVAKANRVVKSARTVELSAVAVFERISREVRKAEAIDTASSVWDVSPGTLSLDGGEGASAYSLEFYLTDGRVRVRQNGIEVGALTQASSTVTSLVFERFSATSTEGVRVQMTVESGTSTAYRSESFLFSTLLR